jgi:hypothetical protein
LTAWRLRLRLLLLLLQRHQAQAALLLAQGPPALLLLSWLLQKNCCWMPAWQGGAGVARVSCWLVPAWVLPGQTHY